MQRHFNVFGQPVELLVTSAQTGGSFALGRQICGPGTGPPPHAHTSEDEVFSIVSGRFEFFSDGAWTEIPHSGIVFAPRGQVHTFRNCGDTPGTIQFISTGSRFDEFLVGLSKFSIPQDIQAVVDYSAPYGISYPTLPPPSDSV